MKVGFIGLGQMGRAMAARLLAGGHEVTVYNRSSAKAAALVDQGARLAESPAGASGGDAVVSMLADDAALESVTLGAEGVLENLRPGAFHVSSSTIGVATAQRLAEAHEARGLRYVAAPVFGRPDAAAAGKLFVVAAGDPAAIEAAQPIFDCIGQRVFVLGERAEAANLVKLSGNFLIMTVIEALAEALTLVEKGGVDKQQYLDLLTATLFSAPVYKNYGAILVERRFEPPGFAAPLGFKDMRLTLQAAEALGVSLPMGSLIRDRFLRLLAEPGAAGLDWSAIGKLAAEDAGIA